MRIAIVLPGLHRVVRGAEVAFEAIACELAKYEDVQVTLFGSGKPRPHTPYKFYQVSNIPRERFERFWPRIPIFRSEYVYEEFTFVLNLARQYRATDFDVTITCSYPFVNWFLRYQGKKHHPAHVFVTQNSDYPAIANSREYRFFGCDGLVCTNLEYFERNQRQWFSELITNGVDPEKFFPRKGDRASLGLPEDVPIALMVSALTPSKRILEGIQAATQVEELHLVVCGDGPEREAVKKVGLELMPGRFYLKQFPYTQMPEIYRIADILLHLSLDEPFGNIYLEALATGLPIVAHDRDVTRWILEDTSILVDTNQPEQIATGIKKALQCNNKWEVQARRELVTRRFTWQAIGKQYYKFLGEVLQKSVNQ